LRAFGGIPKANPNPTGAVSVADIIKDKPIVNISGCPPIPIVITGVLAQILTFGLAGLELDHLGRPKVFYGQSIHDRCYRRPFYERGPVRRELRRRRRQEGLVSVQARLQGPELPTTPAPR
jgi:hydrogenase small subunit